MAKQERERPKPDEDERDKSEKSENGHAPEAAMDESELASYLAERIKPGLNRGAIPLLARSIAREIARDQYHREETDEEEVEPEDDKPVDLEANLHKLQAQLGDDWILSLSVQGSDSWLVAENIDATQRLEAPDASVLGQVVKLLNEGGGRSRGGDE